jgi:AcrR family transcriptional regulator
MDRRTQKTRDAIFSAFGILLQSKQYSKITIQEIIDEANIGRSTFYAHFETKDALLKTLCTDMFEHIFSQSLTREKTHDFSVTKATPHYLIIHVLYHLKDNKQIISSLLYNDSESIFVGYFKEYLHPLVVEILNSSPHMNSLDVPQDFLINHISGSFIGMLRWWIQHDMAEPPEKMADFFYKVI